MSNEPIKTMSTEKQYLPMREVWGLLGKKKVPDGWEDIGEMAPIFQAGEGYMLYSCDNGCKGYNGGTLQYRLARLGGRVVMYCKNCLMFDEVPIGGNASDCQHEWEPLREVRCKKCKFEIEL